MKKNKPINIAPYSFLLLIPICMFVECLILTTCATRRHKNFSNSQEYRDKITQIENTVKELKKQRQELQHITDSLKRNNSR